ncbi:FAD/NAD(P)-dependent oxidoreductase [Alteromonas sp. a30]|uniref:FAD/NAD(P)-dependent oxidoreductase n=1 Tax=Alteromonas sp. a30 TaxID=2730917 RepID=UPI0022805561|nr:FAD/NAD(P)-binding oxidoreductase [Alteromonas sp. a30]MCY7295680.1 NAD(P)/FAD-dependent oxidoreductase [Alteromonas sp. a30]
MSTKNQQVIIVGGGAAGISAAAQLAEFGISSKIIDEATKLGGVVYRGPLRHTEELPHLDEFYQKSQKSLQDKYHNNKDKIDVQLETSVIGPDGANGLILSDQKSLSSLNYDYLILSTGCHERSVPFPGWTLPGVMMMGGVQLQIKSGLVRPGEKMALCGTGPLLPLIACQLHKAGVEVEGVYEASSFTRLAKEAVALLNKPMLTLNGLSMMSYLKRNNVPFHYGWGIVKAEGKEAVEEITVAPYDKEWKADLSKARTAKLDSIGIGYGFVARTQITQLLNLEHEYSYQSSYVPRLSGNQRSSKDNVYVAGDTSGILGSDGAAFEGQIAALDIALRMGAIDAATHASRTNKARKGLQRVRNFRFGFDRFSERQLGMLDLPDDDTVICRCENVKKSQIDAAFERGVKDITSLKMATRAGLGDCQGKICSAYCYDRFKQAGHAERMGQLRARFPVEPISFAMMED